MAIFNSKLLNYWRVAACGRWARLRLPAWMTSRPQDTVQVIWELKHMCIYILYCIVLYYVILYYIILYYIIYFDIYIYVHIMSYKDTSTVYLKLKYTVYIYSCHTSSLYIYTQTLSTVPVSLPFLKNFLTVAMRLLPPSSWCRETWLPWVSPNETATKPGFRLSHFPTYIIWRVPKIGAPQIIPN